MDLNLLQEVKELVIRGKMLSSLGVIFKEKQSFKNCAIKALMSSLYVCKIFSLKTRAAQRIFNTSGSHFIGRANRAISFQ